MTHPSKAAKDLAAKSLVQHGMQEHSARIGSTCAEIMAYISTVVQDLKPEYDLDFLTRFTLAVADGLTLTAIETQKELKNDATSAN